MDAVLNCRKDDLEDYYGLLGCDELSTTEQILNEYKIRALACHPDKNLQDPGAVADFQKLHEAKDVLCNPAKRKNYDLWKRSGVTIPYQDWQALNDTVKTSMHWAVRNKKEPMLEASKADNPATSQAARICPCDIIQSSRDSFHPPYHWVSDSSSSLLQKFRKYEI
ncbi:dnaJ homolog subfamily C member 12 isoform X1 [Xyrichtys novacula]|uniref:DnaJ homolog subfamily C member 12 isoform X1 n=1 Tax=Xyrichtys novacula TaxID=13765 RepID=A0AAV1G0G6_XYRNO|nr:dnaJ homolog subfamily C member 12 isoform X1 [Xyrichtys novacula]